MALRGQRKKRKDAKIDIKPTIPLLLKDSIYRLAYITNIPVKDVGEHLVIAAINDIDIISSISNFFQRDIRINSTLYFGNSANPNVKKRSAPGTCDRISLRLTQNTNNVIEALAYALRCTPTRACAILVENGMHDFTIVNNFVRDYLMAGLDKRRLSELQKVLSYINSMNQSIEYSWADLLSLIVREVNAPVNSPRDMVDEFIIKSWRDNP